MTWCWPLLSSIRAKNTISHLLSTANAVCYALAGTPQLRAQFLLSNLSETTTYQTGHVVARPSSLWLSVRDRESSNMALRLSALRELRFHMCQTSAGSAGLRYARDIITHSLNHVTREFITKQYAGIKEANPSLPLLVRESSNVEARIIARYGTKTWTATTLARLIWTYHVPCTVHLILHCRH